MAERAARPGSEGSVPSPRIRAPWRVQAAFGVIPAVSMATSRYFSERKMAELHDAALRRGASCCHDWAELEKTAGKMVESSLEGSVEKVGVRALAAPVSDIRNQLIS